MTSLKIKKKRKHRKEKRKLTVGTRKLKLAFYLVNFHLTNEVNIFYDQPKMSSRSAITEVCVGFKTTE